MSVEFIIKISIIKVLVIQNNEYRLTPGLLLSLLLLLYIVGILGNIMFS